MPATPEVDPCNTANSHPHSQATPSAHSSCTQQATRSTLLPSKLLQQQCPHIAHYGVLSPSAGMLDTPRTQLGVAGPDATNIVSKGTAACSSAARAAQPVLLEGLAGPAADGGMGDGLTAATADAVLAAAQAEYRRILQQAQLAAAAAASASAAAEAVQAAAAAAASLLARVEAAAKLKQAKKPDAGPELLLEQQLCDSPAANNGAIAEPGADVSTAIGSIAEAPQVAAGEAANHAADGAIRAQELPSPFVLRVQQQQQQQQQQPKVLRTPLQLALEQAIQQAVQKVLREQQHVPALAEDPVEGAQAAAAVAAAAAAATPAAGGTMCSPVGSAPLVDSPSMCSSAELWSAHGQGPTLVMPSGQQQPAQTGAAAAAALRAAGSSGADGSMPPPSSAATAEAAAAEAAAAEAAVAEAAARFVPGSPMFGPMFGCFGVDDAEDDRILAELMSDFAPVNTGITAADCPTMLGGTMCMAAAAAGLGQQQLHHEKYADAVQQMQLLPHWQFMPESFHDSWHSGHVAADVAVAAALPGAHHMAFVGPVSAAATPTATAAAAVTATDVSDGGDGEASQQAHKRQKTTQASKPAEAAATAATEQPMSAVAATSAEAQGGYSQQQHAQQQHMCTLQMQLAQQHLQQHHNQQHQRQQQQQSASAFEEASQLVWATNSSNSIAPPAPRVGGGGMSSFAALAGSIAANAASEAAAALRSGSSAAAASYSAMEVDGCLARAASAPSTPGTAFCSYSSNTATGAAGGVLEHTTGRAASVPLYSNAGHAAAPVSCASAGGALSGGCEGAWGAAGEATSSSSGVVALHRLLQRHRSGSSQK